MCIVFNEGASVMVGVVVMVTKTTMHFVEMKTNLQK